MFVDDIWCATRRGDLEKVREFIESDGIPDVEEEYDTQSLLTVACEAGNENIVRFLLSGSYLGGCYEPCAFAALENGHIAVLRILCEFGLDSDAKEYSKHGPSLLETAVFNKDIQAMKLFLEYDALLKYSWWGPDSDEFGYDVYDPEEHTDATLLEGAAHAGRLDLVEFFLEVGAQVSSESAEAFLKLARENEPLRLKFEAAKRANQEYSDTGTPEEIKYHVPSIGNKPWPKVDANRINKNGDNLLFRLLQQYQKLDEKSLEYLEHLAPLTDLSHTNNRDEHAWEVAERRGEIRAMLYLMDFAGIPVPPEKRARFERELRIKNIKGFLIVATLVIVFSPLIILALLLWGIIWLLLFVKDKIFACFKPNTIQ